MAGFFMGKATEDGMYLWATRVLVLVSFGAHLTMALFAGIRRRRDSGLRRSLVCLAYWLTEIATPVPLGMVFLDTVIAHSEQQLKLFAFWAPFLLLHLGRPDNITSYAWENKKLSPPQIAGPLLATIGAIYGSYKQRFMRGDGALCAAFFIMLFLGSYKYVERAVALHRASFANIRRSNKRKKLRQDRDNALFGVHGLLAVKPGGDYQRPYSGWKDMSKFVEMEASQMYNMLYTKARVIHTWYGYTIRVLSPLATATALYLFHSKEGQTMESTDRMVTYILLVGTLVLDVIWLLIALGSAWTYAFLADREQAEEEKSLLPIHRTIPDNSRWRGQHKKAGHQAGRQSWYWLRLLISLDPSRLSWRSGPTRIGIGHWLLSGVGQCNLLHECSTPHQVKREEIDVRDVLFEVVCEYLEMDKVFKNNAATRRELGDYMRDNARICSFERNIIALHVATDIFLLYEPPLQNKSLLSHRYETQIRVISDYMMFLLAQRQHMVLPPAPGDEASEYKRVHLDLTDIWRGRKFKGEHTGRYDLDMMVDKMGIQYLDDRVDLGMALLKMDETHCNNPEASLLLEKNDTLALGAEWALKLLHQLDPKRFGFPPRTRSQVQSVCSLEDFILVFSDEVQDKIKHYRDGLLPVYLMDYMFRLILVSWIRLLIFTSNQCSRDSHAKQLSCGGELLTIVWLMNQHKENGESIDYV